MNEVFQFRTRLEVSAEDAFLWHARQGAFERLSPPWEHVEVLQRTGGIQNGAVTTLLLRMGPLKIKWVARHFDCVEGRQFKDRQESGPFSFWEHTHRFEPEGSDACWMEDRVEYKLLLGSAGKFFAGAAIQCKLARMFQYRHATLAHDLKLHKKFNGPALNILVTGASGLIGRALTAFLSTGGHKVIPLIRSSPKAGVGQAIWNPASGKIDLSHAGPIDAVVHLAGETVAQRWTPAAKARIRESRACGTRLLCEALAALPQPPRVLVSASGAGYYGNRGEEFLDEQSTPGSGFLAEVSREWEAATQLAAARGIRVVNLRIGIVLTPTGAALAKMLTPFRLGLGGPFSSGKQYWSWLALDDLLGVIHHALITEPLCGPVNSASPNPVTNCEFTKTLGAVLRRPTVFTVPAFAVKLLLGEMGEEALLSSIKLKPARLEESGFRFQFPELEPALRHLLGK